MDMEFATGHHLGSTLVYVVTMGLWVVLWRHVGGFALMRGRVPALWLPFLLALAYLAANALLAFTFAGMGTAVYEESRFAFIDDRATIAVQTFASILVVATIVYGLTIRRLPVAFIRFMAYAIVAILGLVAPILWIPDGFASGFFILRHLQNAALTVGLFLTVAGVIVMLGDLMAHGDAKVAVGKDDPDEPPDPDAVTWDDPARADRRPRSTRLGAFRTHRDDLGGPTDGEPTREA